VKSVRHYRRTLSAVAAATMTLSAVVGCGAGGPSGNGKDATLDLAFSSNYVFDTAALTTRFYNQVKAEFQKEHPGVTVKLTPIAGSYQDLVTKLSLLYRSSGTAPDVAQIPTPEIGEWSSAGYLLGLNSYLKSASWWKGFPKDVRSEGTSGGVTYAVNSGENDSFIYYDKSVLQKAGVSLPWEPKNWQDIISAGQAIKRAEPNVVPIWLAAGTDVGTNAILQGGGNLLDGSVNPTVYDSRTHKWVVDSPGLENTLNFFHEVYGGGLGAPASDVFTAREIGSAFRLFPKGQLGIAIGSNWYGGAWTKTIEGPTGPFWNQAATAVGVAPIPTQNGQGSGIASTLGGFDYAVSKGSANPQLAFDLVSLMEDKQNEIDAANWAGFVPPNTSFGSDSSFAGFAPPFNTESVKVLPYATITPSSANYSIWAQGFNEATGAIAQNPRSTSVSQAISTLGNYVQNQLGSNAVEKIH
jgi:multiple sugar transport system substrate-binding protein